MCFPPPLPPPFVKSLNNSALPSPLPFTHKLYLLTLCIIRESTFDPSIQCALATRYNDRSPTLHKYLTSPDWHCTLKTPASQTSINKKNYHSTGLNCLTITTGMKSLKQMHIFHKRFVLWAGICNLMTYV